MLTVRFDTLGLQAGDVVLDLGAGGGRHAFEVVRRGAKVIAADLSEGDLRSAASTAVAMQDAKEIPTYQFVCAQTDAYRLPFKDNSFDRIVVSEVMEHLQDEWTAWSELHRVLKPGGTIGITVPSWLPERVNWALSDDYHWPAQPGGHVRIYSSDELKTRMRTYGLDPYADHRAHGLHSPYWWLKCAVGVKNADHPAVKAYHRLLVWDLMKRPVATRAAEAVLAPVLGKSYIVYGRKAVDGCKAVHGRKATA